MNPAMLIVLANGSAPASGLTVTYEGNEVQDSSATTYNYSITHAGVAGDVIVLVLIAEGTEGGVARSLSSATFDGNSATPVVSGGNTSSLVFIFAVTGYAADTYTLSATFDNAMFRSSVGQYTVEGGASTTPADTDFAGAASGTDLTGAVDIPAGAVAVGGYVTGTQVTHTWSGATKDYDVGVNTGMSGAHIDATGSLRTAHSVGASHSSSSQPIGLAVAVFE